MTYQSSIRCYLFVHFTGANENKTRQVESPWHSEIFPEQSIIVTGAPLQASSLDSCSGGGNERSLALNLDGSLLQSQPSRSCSKRMLLMQCSLSPRESTGRGLRVLESHDLLLGCVDVDAILAETPDLNRLWRRCYRLRIFQIRRKSGVDMRREPSTRLRLCFTLVISSRLDGSHSLLAPRRKFLRLRYCLHQQ